MKFLYEYRTSDNVKHSGEICAADREAAYSALKRKGIKPSRFSEAPGVFNKVFGKGKRWIAIGVLVVVAIASTVFALLTKRDAVQAVGLLDSSVRRQIIGDQAVIEKGILTGWSDVFEHQGDRFLASFAVPGISPAVRSVSEEVLMEVLRNDSEVVPLQSSLEARQIVAIVSGMKNDIRVLLKEGWTLREVGTALVQRQEREISYYERAKTEIEKAKSDGMQDAEVVELWEKRNDSLRRLGIRLVPFPEKIEEN